MSVKVRATKDFRSGPYRAIVIRNGDTRIVALRADETFYTFTNERHFFGSCKLGAGWELVETRVNA